MVAPSVCTAASAVVPSAGTFTPPGTRKRSILSSSGQYWLTFSMILFCVTVGITAPAEEVPVVSARCSFSVRSSPLTCLSQAERYSLSWSKLSAERLLIGLGTSFTGTVPAPIPSITAFLFSRLVYSSSSSRSSFSIASRSAFASVSSTPRSSTLRLRISAILLISSFIVIYSFLIFNSRFLLSAFDGGGAAPAP